MVTYRAAALYDGGWRSEDRDQLIQEYELTDQEADEISTELAEIQKNHVGREEEEQNAD